MLASDLTTNGEMEYSYYGTVLVLRFADLIVSVLPSVFSRVSASHRAADSQPHLSQYAATAHPLRVPHPSWGYFPMLRPLLVVSRDEHLLKTRAMVLGVRGFLTIGTTSTAEALKIAEANNPAVVVLCHTYSGPEQWRFVTKLRRVCPTAFVLRLKAGEVNPEQLIADCDLCFMPSDPSEDLQADASTGSAIRSNTDTRVNASKPDNVIQMPAPILDRARP